MDAESRLKKLGMNILSTSLVNWVWMYLTIGYLEYHVMRHTFVAIILGIQRLINFIRR